MLFVLMFFSSRFLFEEGEICRVTHKLRNDLIRQAAIWRPVDIAHVNVSAGPQSEIAVPPETEVTCEYVEPRGSSEGYSPKFKCKLAPSGQIVRVKFGSGEAFSEIAATRLLWSLGFYADNDYPVRIRCRGCPIKNPAHPSENEARAERVFEDTMMEENFPGKEIGEYHDQGWTWKELDEAEEKLGEGDVKRAQTDALKLLAVFIQHTDSKHQQQRLACFEKDIQRNAGLLICKQAVLMIQDLGETFGKGGEEITASSAMSLPDWGSVPIWNAQKEATYLKEKGKPACFGNLTSAKFAGEDGLNDPKIGEEGRRFLAGLLNQLSDQQILDLFRVARADKTKTPASIEAWAAAFEKKRQEINDRTCPD